MASPISAVSSGSPAAISELSATASTAKATTTANTTWAVPPAAAGNFC
jgi:hypothetical protein